MSTADIYGLRVTVPAKRVLPPGALPFPGLGSRSAVLDAVSLEDIGKFVAWL